MSAAQPTAFSSLRREAAPRVDGMTWQDYEADLDRRIEDLQVRVRRGADRAQPSRRRYIPKRLGPAPIGACSPGDLIRRRRHASRRTAPSARSIERGAVKAFAKTLLGEGWNGGHADAAAFVDPAIHARRGGLAHQALAGGITIRFPGRNRRYLHRLNDATAAPEETAMTKIRNFAALLALSGVAVLPACSMFGGDDSSSRSSRASYSSQGYAAAPNYNSTSQPPGARTDARHDPQRAAGVAAGREIPGTRGRRLGPGHPGRGADLSAAAQHECHRATRPGHAGGDEPGRRAEQRAAAGQPALWQQQRAQLQPAAERNANPPNTNTTR